MMPRLAALPADITVGDHPHFKFVGLTFNYDTMYTTALAAALTIALIAFVAIKASSRVPNRTQIVTEVVITQVRGYLEDAVGHDVPPYLVPFGVTLFLFILFCNWMAWFPSGHSPERLGPPTADVNLVYALALTVVVLYTYLGVKRKGRKYVTDWFTAKPAIRRPILLIEQLVNPLSLSLRLFGNIFAGGIMLSVIALLPFYLFPLYGLADFGWRLFDSGLIAPIQAFIFSFLTILYFGMATAEEH
ncbi:MAG TPA: F0F1 ATP synthase subunit A [Mycobacteriales bacterium]|jgi:F-type H+-transporting ATPase subunit a|nr:F0F1 ATP synthase subunit A [Mycobacteriales bacterium]